MQSHTAERLFQYLKITSTKQYIYQEKANNLTKCIDTKCLGKSIVLGSLFDVWLIKVTAPKRHECSQQSTYITTISSI